MFMYPIHFYYLHCLNLENLLDRRHRYMLHHQDHPITCFILQFFVSFSLTQIVRVFSVTFIFTVTCSSICKSLTFFLLTLITNSFFISLWLIFPFGDPIISVCTDSTFHVSVFSFLPTFLKTHFIFLPTLQIVICLTKMKIVDLTMVAVYGLGKIKGFNFITLTDAHL